ncbi:hypothetical protein C0J52_26474, partial [Blattella germanica]
DVTYVTVKVQGQRALKSHSGDPFDSLPKNFWYEFSSPFTESYDEFTEAEPKTTPDPLPFFEDHANSTNVTTQFGSTVNLHCKVNDLRDRTAVASYIIIVELWKGNIGKYEKEGAAIVMMAMEQEKGYPINKEKADVDSMRETQELVHQPFWSVSGCQPVTLRGHEAATRGWWIMMFYVEQLQDVEYNRSTIGLVTLYSISNCQISSSNFNIGYFFRILPFLFLPAIVISTLERYKRSEGGFEWLNLGTWMGCFFRNCFPEVKGRVKGFFICLSQGATQLGQPISSHMLKKAARRYSPFSESRPGLHSILCTSVSVDKFFNLDVIQVTGNANENILSFDETPGIRQLASQITCRFSIDSERSSTKTNSNTPAFQRNQKLKIKLFYRITNK